MKDYVICIFLLLSCLISKGQKPFLSEDGRSVNMPIETYRKLREKSLLCDSISYGYKEQIQIKDSIIFLKQQEIKNFESIVVVKDTTINKLSFEVNYLQKENAKHKQPFKNTGTWVGITIGLVFGFLIAN